MFAINIRPLMLLGVNLVFIIGLSVSLTLLFINQGISALWLFMLLLLVLFSANMLVVLTNQYKQLFQVIKALANGDSSLGFASTNEMQNYYKQVRQQMLSAKLKAEQQSQFLKTLLIHIDLAVIVCNEQHQVIETNPAVSRLLGTKIRRLEQLKHMSPLVTDAQKNFSTTVQWLNGEQQDTLSMRVSLAHIQGEELKIITLQSIHETLLNKEQQAYKRLTQVLTHEVANTITPLASIAQTCHSLLPQSLTFTDDQTKQNMSLALQTMSSRTQYLGEFITNFRKVSSLPSPELSPASLDELLQRIHILHKQQLEQANIALSIDIQSKQLVMLDKAQIEQVLINLVKNAIEVLASRYRDPDITNTGEIQLTVGKNAAQQLFVDVADNGSGVSEQALDMVFVPFFTTKQKGSGIGLSLSKQIMINHGGDLIYVQRQQGACFRCIFG